MKRVFADAAYWIARLNTRDKYHGVATSILRNNGDAVLITTEAVLTEVLNQFCSSGDYWRKLVSTSVQEILRQSFVIVLPNSHELFMQGLQFYTQRLDKEYSHVDCMSMVVMRNENITDVLTTDHHFAQEGFTVLLKA